MTDPQSRIVQLTQDIANGDSHAATELVPLVYDELRRIAAGMLRAERAGHTLQPTALVNEAFVRMAGPQDSRWSGRQHFMAAAAVAMRRILVNHARERKADKRGGGGWKRITLSDAAAIEGPGSTIDCDLCELDEALDRLESQDATQARIVELRFFGGLEVADIAALLGISERTVVREWRMARARLGAALRRGHDEAGGEA
jgi:RNA polymerase sigma factor (TIGR02999 family)